ncbi:division/cell wall cluster transcriptional repressor MraZ [Erythrobacter sp.]|uniref:division/cell wall cluster transcriptional repressor MraZ n=1 Tax=Erythrobacter sp. TaxID=1042 RepID=UPI00260D0ED3|nr:division/cell wall cluster transcriptional repressor MraZ [Erythrobacter sp.]
MSAFGGYSGQAYSPAGDKGRFVLPPDFRNGIKLASGGQKTLCLARHHKWKEGWKCLIGFGVNYEAELENLLAHEEDMAARTGEPFDRDRRRMSLYSYRKLPFDDSGRFVMPEALRKRAGIEAGIYLNGMGTYFTLWAPETLEKLGEDFEDILMDCEDAMAEAEAKSRKRGG